MHLRDYLTQHKLTQAAFGKLLVPEVSTAKVNHWLQGQRRVSLVEALQIRELTAGAVTVEDLARLTADLEPQAAPAAAETEALAEATGAPDGIERRRYNTLQHPDLERRAPLAAALAGGV